MDKFQEIFQIGEEIYLNPELGYKETHTSTIVENYVKKYLPEVKIQKFGQTGLKFNLPRVKKEINIALVAELDAVFAPSHFHANCKSGAAHNCGHHTQVAIMLHLFRSLVENNNYKNLDFSIGFVFVPAEEYLDLDYRKRLKEQGVITYFGGKAEGIKLAFLMSMILGYVFMQWEEFSQKEV